MFSVYYVTQCVKKGVTFRRGEKCLSIQRTAGWQTSGSAAREAQLHNHYSKMSVRVCNWHMLEKVPRAKMDIQHVTHHIGCRNKRINSHLIYHSIKRLLQVRPQINTILKCSKWVMLFSLYLSHSLHLHWTVYSIHKDTWPTILCKQLW